MLTYIIIYLVTGVLFMLVSFSVQFYRSPFSFIGQGLITNLLFVLISVIGWIIILPLALHWEWNKGFLRPIASKFKHRV